MDFARSLFFPVLARAHYVPKLEEEGQGTLLAPSNDAFARMNPRLMRRLLEGDRKCLQSKHFTLSHHELSNLHFGIGSVDITWWTDTIEE